jgi:hypothetical protein
MVVIRSKSSHPAFGHLLPLVKTNGRRRFELPSPVRLRMGEGARRADEGTSMPRALS